MLRRVSRSRVTAHHSASLHILCCALGRNLRCSCPPTTSLKSPLRKLLRKKSARSTRRACRKPSGANARTCWSTWSASPHRAQRRLCARPRSRPATTTAPARRIGHARTLTRRRRGVRQRHRRAWRGFRRHLRGRPGACRRGDRAGRAGRLRAAQPGGRAALLGIAVGVETMCRLALVAPKLMHKAGFHPTAVFGAMAAAAGVGAALGLDAAPTGGRARHRRQSWRRASSSISPRAPGPSGMHAGWAAQSGLRAALMAAPASPARAPCSKACTASFTASRTPPHGDYDALIGGLRRHAG